MQHFFSEKHVALHLGYRPSESTAATRTLSYEHNDKDIFLFTKQPDRLGAQPGYRWYSGRAVLQHIRLDLLPTSRMSKAMPPLPHTPSWCDRNSIGGWGGGCKVPPITVPLAMPVTASVVTQ